MSRDHDELVELRKSIEELTKTSRDLVQATIEPVARVEAVKVYELLRESQRLRHRMTTYMIIFVLAMTALSTFGVLDGHVHVAHILPVEEALGINADAHRLPLFPREGQGSWPIGLSLMSFLAFVSLASAIGYARTLRSLRIREEWEEEELRRDIDLITDREY